MAIITFGAIAGNWSDATKWVGGVKPTSADDVKFTAASGNCTVDDATAACRSRDMTGYLGTLNGTGTLTIGDGSGGADTLAGTLSGSYATVYASTSNNGGAGWPITMNGKAHPGTVTVNGVGNKMVCQDAYSSGTVTVTAGGFFGNGQTITCSQVVSNGSTTRTVDITNCAVTCTSASGSAWNFAFGGLTFTSTGSTITFSGANPTTTMATLTYNNLVWSGLTGAATCNSGGCTAANITCTAGASKTASIGFAAFTWTGTLKFVSNSAVNRLLVQSTVVGTQRTFTGTGGTVNVDNTAAAAGSSVDFKDINIAGSPTWTPLNSTLVGDCGGNSGSLSGANITTPATQTATGTASFTWSTHGWTSRVPLPQDDVNIPNAFVAGRVITQDMPRLGASISRAGGSGSVTFSPSLTVESYGSLTLVAGDLTTGSQTWNLAGRSSYTITTAAVTFTDRITISAPSGTYTLQDAFTSSRSAAGIIVDFGTLVDNGQTVTFTGANGAYQQTGGTLTKTGAWSFSTTGAVNFWQNTGGTVSDSGSITLTATSANTRTFAGGGKTYGTLTYTVAGSTGILAITGNNTWTGDWNFSDATNARSVQIVASSTQTFTKAGNPFVGVGSAGKLVTLTSSVAGTFYTFTKTTDTIIADFYSIKDSHAGGGAAWYATHSTDVSGNTGWVFTVLVAIGEVLSTSTAQPITAPKTVTLDEAVEVDTATALALLKALTLGQTFEIDTAQSATPTKAVDVGQPVETDMGQPLTTLKTLDLSQAVEQDEAQAVLVLKALAVAQALGFDEAEPLTHGKLQALAQALEGDAALAVSSVKVFDILGAEEVDDAQPTALTYTYVIGEPAELDDAQPLTRTKVTALLGVPEHDTALAPTVGKMLDVGAALELDEAFTPVMRRTRLLTQALERDLAPAVHVSQIRDARIDGPAYAGWHASPPRTTWDGNLLVAWKTREPRT